ncbi:ion transporter [Leptobacterium flavescens]|uniref:Ion transporter n=1 Tax=Leptobacterium flavescens TaxID=472055 RepID=A0A6P0UIX3_9FLAO|nr:ion transporter [Leptobacterium flavescens]NER13321.1 ion transporter [Leptobacterium flavescens]
MFKRIFNKKLKNQLHEIIYEADTPAGKLFDVALLILILASIVLVMLESVNAIDAKYHNQLLLAEWIVTILFTLEYIARIISLRKPVNYIFSFYGIIDFLATIPLYISYFFAGSQVLLALRAFRLLRVFRILKLVRFIGEASQLKEALRSSRAKITVFVYTVLILAVIMGTIMYLVEGDRSGFNSIPRSIYWTIVTLTTVGYGDIAPQTALGQAIASLIMIIGYGIIAVPTGIVTAEFAMQGRKKKEIHMNTQSCPSCGVDGHRDDAKHCFDCGTILNDHH